MRLAVISDIHGNVFALEAVLADIRSREVDHVVNLGDHFYGPLAPKATLDLLMQEEMFCILGNQDRLLLESRGGQRPANATLDFVLEELGAQGHHWLERLPANQQLGPCFCCHGTPTDDSVYLLEDVCSGRPQVRPYGEIAALAGDCPASLLLCGHSHIPRLVQLPGGPLVVNPGSVGLPAYHDDEPMAHRMETFCPHGVYALAEARDSGWLIELVRVPYAHEEAAALARNGGREDWAQFLLTGRAAVA